MLEIRWFMKKCKGCNDYPPIWDQKQVYCDDQNTKTDNPCD